MPGATSATDRIAAKLAAKSTPKAKAAPEPEPVEDDEDDLEEIEEEGALTAPEGAGGDLDEDDDEQTPNEAKAEIEQATNQSIKERAAAARAKRSGKEPTPISEAPSAKKAKAAAPAAKGKKPASPAQLAARQAFKERSQARAAEARAARGEVDDEAADVKPAPIQTELSAKEKQSAARKAAQAARAAESKPTRAATSKSVTVQAPKTATKAEKAKATKAANKSGTKVKAEKAPRSDGETRQKVHALLAKGKTRQEIMETLGLSYPSVFYHSKSYEGAVTSRRGNEEYEVNLDSAGEKLPKGKKEKVNRSEAMRREWRAGMAVGDVARKYEVRYQLAYTAIKPIMGSVEAD